MNRYFYKFYEILKYKRFDKLVFPGEIFTFLLESQYWDRQKLTEYQLNCLNELLVYAKKSHFYNELYHDINLPIGSLEEIKNIPVVAKDDLQRSFNSFATGEYLKNGYFIARDNYPTESIYYDSLLNSINSVIDVDLSSVHPDIDNLGKQKIKLLLKHIAAVSYTHLTLPTIYSV